MHSCPPAQVPVLESSQPAPGLPWAGGWTGNGTSGGAGDTGIHQRPSWHRNHIQAPFQGAVGSSCLLLIQNSTAPGWGPCLSSLRCRTFTKVFSRAIPAQDAAGEAPGPWVCIPGMGEGQLEPVARSHLSCFGSRRHEKTMKSNYTFLGSIYKLCAFFNLN